MLCGSRPIPPAETSPGETVPGFEKVVDPEALDVQYGHFPVQPDDKSHVWGVNSPAQLPAFGGKVRSEIAQQCGYRAPEVSMYEEGTNSGLRLLVSDPGAALTGPGSGTAKQSSATDDSVDPVKKNAELLGKLLAVRLGDCFSDP